MKKVVLAVVVLAVVAVIAYKAMNKAEAPTVAAPAVEATPAAK